MSNPRSLEEWVTARTPVNQFIDELDQKIRRFAVAPKTSPDWLELTDAERQGDPASMMFAVFWPKRWLIETMTAAIREALRCVHCGVSDVKPICDECFQAHYNRGRKISSNSSA